MAAHVINSTYNFFFRSVFKLLEETLSETQHDECFNAFNMASHNAGVENLRNSLKFLDGIFGRIQNHV